jgi:hypothetical protein
MFRGGRLAAHHDGHRRRFLRHSHARICERPVALHRPADSAIRDKFVPGQGFELMAPAGGSPAELTAFLLADRAKVVGTKMD